MTTRVVERPPATPQDPWATVPVVVGRHRQRWGWAVVVLVIAAAGAIALLLFQQAPSTSQPAPQPVPQPAAQPAPPEPDIAASTPFVVTMDVAEVATMDNDGLFGRDARIPERAVDAATRQIDDVLTRYLDAQFITAQTRFSDAPLDDLLSRRALAVLSDDDRAGLGVLGLSVQAVQADPVTATARVLTSGSDVVVVTVRYDAHASVVTDDGGTLPLRQRATAAFVPDDGAWRVDAVNATLELPLRAGEVAP